MIKYCGGGGEKEKKNGAQREGGVSGNGGSLETNASTHVCGVPLPWRSQPRLQTTLRKSSLWWQSIGGSCHHYSNQSELPPPSSRKPRPTAAAATAAAEDAAAEGAQNDRTEQEDNQLLASFCAFVSMSQSSKKASFSFSSLPRDDVTS